MGTKAQLLDELIGAYELRLSDYARAHIKAARAAGHEPTQGELKAPSHKEEQRRLANALTGRAEEIGSALANLRRLRGRVARTCSIVQAGALVTVQNVEAKETYFLFPYGSGLTVTVAGRQIICVSPDAALARALIGRESGDTVAVQVGQNVITHKIVSVS